MVDWHMELSKLAPDNQVEIYMYSRFVDDTADARKALTPGLRWEEGSMVMEPEVVEEDQIIPGYLRITREFFLTWGAPLIPSNHASGKVPALDTQLWN